MSQDRPDPVAELERTVQELRRVRRAHLNLLQDLAAAKEAAEQANAELRRSNVELEQFAYVASHDLREPLRMVTSFGLLLQEHLGSSLDERGKQYLHFMVDGGTRMQSLVDDLLAYSRVGRSGRTPAWIDPAAAARGALLNLAAAIAETDADVVVEPMPRAWADEALLRLALQNLVGNAIKYRAEGVRPRVVIGGELLPGGTALWVRDNGIGIAPEHHERIFLLFQRLHGRGRYPGTGIGLASVRKVVDIHGGRITVDSTLGEGASFTLFFPQEEAP
jgi:light-regulated signal transduction histidine kinase (bacteriophytochrome)